MAAQRVRAELPELAGYDTAVLDLLVRPVWVLDPVAAHNVYANRAALAFWGAASVEAFAERSHADMSATSRARLDEAVRRAENGEVVADRWTFYPHGRPVTVDLLQSAIRLPNGRVGLLVEALPAAVEPVDRRAAEALRYATVVAVLYDEDGRPVFRNPAALAVYPGDDHRFADRFADPADAESIWRRVRGGETVSTFMRVETAVGERWHGLDARQTTDPVSGRPSVLVNERDVSELKAVEQRLVEREHQLVEAQEIARLGDWRLDLATDLVRLSASLAATWGAHGREVSRASLLERLHPEDRASFDLFLRRVASDGQTKEMSFRLLDGAGAVTHLWQRCGPHRDARGRIVEVIGIARDVTEEMLSRARATYLSQHDGLTGLVNRVCFSERLELELKRGPGGDGALMLLDVDGFKEINDTRGQAAGDAVLVEIANRLQAASRGTDIVGRLGGDEFGIVMPGLSEIDVLDRRAEAIRQVLSAPILVAASLATVSVSVGLSTWPADGETVAEVMRNADLALQSAKSERGGGTSFFTRAMREAIEDRRSIVDALPKAIEAGDIEVHYQPIVALGSRAVAGFEALVRWRHPERGLIFPDEFIGVAEDAGLMWRLGNHVLEVALAQVRRWTDAGLEPGRIAVNLGAGQLQHPGLAQFVAGALDRSGVPPGQLELEVTETVTLRPRASTTSASIEELHRLGVAIVLDDFGTGHASLTHVKRLPIDRLKIDRGFVANIEQNGEDAAIVRMLIGLARDLEIAVVAEGVETDRQARFLALAGCELAQGYLFGRPMAASDATRWLAHSRHEVH